ncbi:MAG: hypothetical protein J6U49_05985 [Alistipes sp.]|nr:hypothetical protein [Alistipes sp.]
MTNVTLNGTPLADMGVMMLLGAYAALLAPSPMKNYITNDDPTKDGIEVDVAIPKRKDRDVTLTFLVQGKTQADFLNKLDAFLTVLYRGRVELYVPDLSAKYRLLYTSSTQFANYMLNACKLSVKFKEPDPTNRGI